MSNDACTYIKRLPIKSQSARAVLRVIADYMSNLTFDCYPSQELIGREACMSLTQVKFHVAALVKSGVLIRTERKNTRNGQWTHNVYQIVDYEEWYRRRYFDTPIGENAQRKAEQHDAIEASTAGFPAVDEISQTHSRVSAKTHSRVLLKSTAGNPAPILNSKDSKKKESDLRHSSQISAENAYLAGEGAPKKSGSRKRQGSLPIEETAEARTDVDGLAKMDEADVKAFCVVADEFGLAKPERLSAVRRDKLRSLRREHGASAWGRALAAVKASSFLQGKAGKIGAFRVSFDKLLDPEFFLKVIEGTYADKAATVIKLKTNATRHEWGFRLEIWQKSGFATWSRIWGPPPGDPACVAPADLIEEYRAKGMPDPDAVTAR